jgi:hypothetical protein
MTLAAEKVSDSQPALVDFLAQPYIGQGIFSRRAERFASLQAANEVFGFSLV